MPEFTEAREDKRKNPGCLLTKRCFSLAIVRILPRDPFALPRPSSLTIFYVSVFYKKRIRKKKTGKLCETHTRRNSFEKRDNLFKKKRKRKRFFLQKEKKIEKRKGKEMCMYSLFVGSLHAVSLDRIDRRNRVRGLIINDN